MALSIQPSAIRASLSIAVGMGHGMSSGAVGVLCRAL